MLKLGCVFFFFFFVSCLMRKRKPGNHFSSLKNGKNCQEKLIERQSGRSAVFFKNFSSSSFPRWVVLFRWWNNTQVTCSYTFMLPLYRQSYKYRFSVRVYSVLTCCIRKKRNGKYKKYYRNKPREKKGKRCIALLRNSGARNKRLAALNQTAYFFFASSFSFFFLGGFLFISTSEPNKIKRWKEKKAKCDVLRPRSSRRQTRKTAPSRFCLIKNGLVVEKEI